MSINETEDALYQAYLADPKEHTEQLYAALLVHAKKVVWDVLHEWHPSLAMEIVSHALENVTAFRGDSLFGTWFHRVAINKCLRELQLRARRKEDPLPDEAESSDNRLDAVEAHIHLMQLAKQLSDTERELLFLKLEGWSEAEIGESMGLTGKAIRNRWLRMRKKLNESSGSAEG